MATIEEARRAAIREFEVGVGQEGIIAAMDAYALATRLAVLNEILEGEYTREQVADMRLRAVEEDVS